VPAAKCFVILTERNVSRMFTSRKDGSRQYGIESQMYVRGLRTHNLLLVKLPVVLSFPLALFAMECSPDASALDGR